MIKSCWNICLNKRNLKNAINCLFKWIIYPKLTSRPLHSKKWKVNDKKLEKKNFYCLFKWKWKKVRLLFDLECDKIRKVRGKSSVDCFETTEKMKIEIESEVDRVAESAKMRREMKKMKKESLEICLMIDVSLITQHNVWNVETSLRRSMFVCIHEACYLKANRREKSW